MALFRNFGVNHAKDVTGLCGIACAAYKRAPPHNAADFLELAKNCPFLDRKLISALKEAVDGHYQPTGRESVTERLMAKINQYPQ